VIGPPSKYLYHYGNKATAEKPALLMLRGDAVGHLHAADVLESELNGSRRSVTPGCGNIENRILTLLKANGGQAGNRIVAGLLFGVGERNLVGGNVDDFPVFPENHGDAGAAVFEDSFAEGTAEGGFEEGIVRDALFKRFCGGLNHDSIVSQFDARFPAR